MTATDHRLGRSWRSYAHARHHGALSIHDREFELVITFAFDAGRGIIDTLDWLVSGSYWGRVAVNHLRE